MLQLLQRHEAIILRSFGLLGIDSEESVDYLYTILELSGERLQLDLLKHFLVEDFMLLDCNQFGAINMK